MQKNEIQPPIYTIHTNKLEMDKRLKYKSNIIKVLEENIGGKISDIPHSNIFTNISPRARNINEIINKWDYIRVKGFTAKETIIKMKRNQPYGNTFLPMIPQTRV